MFQRRQISALNKLVEAVRTNYNDRYDEVSIYYHVKYLFNNSLIPEVQTVQSVVNS